MMLVVILAGGEGRRIGGDKPARMLGGITLLERALRQAATWSNRVVVAARNQEQASVIDSKVIIDDHEIEGPLGGLAAGLRFARNAGAPVMLTLPADMPFLPPDLSERLGASIGDNAAAIASSGGHLHPVCGLWRTGALDRLPQYLASGRRSLRGFAEVVGHAAVDWPAEPRDPFFNINSASDLADAERLLRD